MITIYGKPECVYCTQAKQVCEANDLEYKYIDIQESNISKEVLEEKAGGPVRAVPQIFNDDVYIGTYQKFVAYVRDIG